MPMLPAAPRGGPRGDQRWATFLKNHARGIIACDFCIVVTATFRILYVLVVMEHASRRLIHLNATAQRPRTGSAMGLGLAGLRRRADASRRTEARAPGTGECRPDP
jgi:hypothetical protein